MQTITLELPDPIMQRVEERAHKSQRTLENELVFLISDSMTGLPRNGSPMAFHEVIDALASGGTPERLATFRLSAKTQARAQELLAHSKSGTLTPTEEAELNLFVQLEHLMGLVKARAKQILRENR